MDSLPSELLLEILRYVEPYPLFHTLRLVNRRFKAAAEDVYTTDILPGARVSLYIIVEDTPYTPKEDLRWVGLELRFQYSPEKDLFQLVHMSRPASKHDKAIKYWKALESYGARDLTLRMSIPGCYVVPLKGRQWMAFSERTARNDRSLKLEWKKLVVMYLRQDKALRDAASKGPQFPLY